MANPPERQKRLATSATGTRSENGFRGERRAVEAYPVDPPGRMDLTMAFVGTKSMFDRAGFHVIGTTDAVASGVPRLVMRHDLKDHV